MVAIAKSIVAKEFIPKTLLTVLLFVSQVGYSSSWPSENEKRATSCHEEVKKVYLSLHWEPVASWGRVDPNSCHRLALPSSFPDVCVFHLGFCEQSLEWRRLKEAFIFRPWKVNFRWYEGKELRPHRNSRLAHYYEHEYREIVLPGNPIWGAGDSNCHRDTHHWWRDCSCLGCRGPAEWHHGSTGLAPRRAVLCPAWSLWDVGDGCRLYSLWYLFPPLQPWRRRDMGIRTYKRWILLTTPSFSCIP